MKKLLALALVLVAGCLSNAPSVTSGQHLTIGLWIPLADGQTFGLQFLDYLQGSKFIGTTNCMMEVSHRTASTNEYFSIVRTHEKVEDEAKIK